MRWGDLQNVPVQFDLILVVAIYATLPFRAILKILFNSICSLVFTSGAFMIWVSPDGATRRVIQYRILIYHKGCMYNILHKQKNSLIQLFISGHSYMLLSLILLCAYSRQLIPYVTTPRRYDIFTLLHSVLTPQALQKRQQVLPQGA